MPGASAHNLLSFSGFLVGPQVGRSSVSLVFRRRVLALPIRLADGPLSRHTASLTLATGAPLNPGGWGRSTWCGSRRRCWTRSRVRSSAAKWALRVPDAVLRPTLASVLAMVGIRMVL